VFVPGKTLRGPDEVNASFLHLGIKLSFGVIAAPLDAARGQVYAFFQDQVVGSL